MYLTFASGSAAERFRRVVIVPAFQAFFSVNGEQTVAR
jgi:hypothetical protein